jgi:hypothetical protein
MKIDAYTFQARLVPMFILLLPLDLAFLAVFPVTSYVSGILALLGTLSAQTLTTILLSEIGRDAGKKKESSLFKRWGGMPTDCILSEASPLDLTTIGRYKNKLKLLLPDVVFPTAEEEISNRNGAIGVYRSCTNFLRERTRDTTKFALTFKENVSYGFRRNLWGMKPAGLLIVCIGIAVSTFQVLAVSYAGSNAVIPIICLIANVTLLVMWLLRITPNWVKVPADEYAKQLFAACETL